jgi:thioesterase domain-containing protein/acyl carrier protein
MVAPFVFDASVMHMFGALLAGNTLCVVPDEVKMDGAGLLRFVAIHGLDVLEGAPTHLAMILEAAEMMDFPVCLEHITMGGEVLPKQLVRRMINILGEKAPRLTNMYGPTEVAVMSTTYPVPLEDIDALNTVPIGKPLSNYHIYILDKGFKPQPVGVIGELHIGGPGLARGYLNNPELTAKMFSGGLYRTGDLGRWLPDGNIEFSGRRDHQVKIRGFRIELGEIEHGLLTHPDVKEAAVIERRKGEDHHYLCAYIVMSEKGEPAPELTVVLKEHLARTLPGYMIPPFFVGLERLPLTVSGKVDRRALPEPGFAEEEEKVEPPDGPIESALVKMAAGVLGIPAARLGSRANFFERGASSLDMVKLASVIHRELDIEIPVVAIFKNPSVKELARVVAESRFNRYEEDEVSVFNPGKEKILWGFPPAIGYGFVYTGLAGLLEDHTVYGFNFIEGEDRLDRYVELITAYQPQGPYTLFSYSAGGELAMEVANHLEQQGHRVAAVLLLDCSRNKGKPGDRPGYQFPEAFMDIVEKSMEELGVEYLKDKVRHKVAAYSEYFWRPKRLKPLHADIYHLAALKREDQKKEPDHEDPGWRELVDPNSGCVYREHQASGFHGEMLEGEHLKKNAALIRRILEMNEQQKVLSSGRTWYGKLSRTGVEFLEYVKQTPEALEFSQYERLDLKDELVVLQPWPLFVSMDFKGKLQEAGVEVCRLIKSLPRRLFDNDPHKMSGYFEMPPHMIETQLRDGSQEHLDLLLARGDFILSEQGLKCLEFNITASLGGMDLPVWEQLYRQVPVISRFLESRGVTIYNQNLHTLFFEHLIGSVDKIVEREPGGKELNAAFVGGGLGLQAGQLEGFLNPLFQQQLQLQKPGTTGHIMVCDYPDVTVRDKKAFARDKKIDVMVEWYNGVVPPEILELEKQRRLCVLNGPVTGLLTNKLNLALLSENKDSHLFEPHEKEWISKYIPWSRKTAAVETTDPDGKTVKLEEYLYQNKDGLVLKPAGGYSGIDVIIGKQTSPDTWAKYVKKALEERKWVAQEHIVPVPLVNQLDEWGCGEYDVVWGLFVLGGRYAGAMLRQMPRRGSGGIINAAQGATVSLVFEVNE